MVEHILTTEFKTDTDLHSWIVHNRNTIKEIISINQKQSDRKWVLWFIENLPNDSVKDDKTDNTLKEGDENRYCSCGKKLGSNKGLGKCKECLEEASR